MDQYPITALMASGEGFTVREIVPYEKAVVPGTVRVDIVLEKDRRKTFFYISQDRLPAGLEKNLPAFCYFRDNKMTCPWKTKEKFPTE